MKQSSGDDRHVESIAEKIAPPLFASELGLLRSCLEADLTRQCCSFFQYTSIQDGAEERLSFLLTMSNVLHYQEADGLGS